MLPFQNYHRIESEGSGSDLFESLRDPVVNTFIYHCSNLHCMLVPTRWWMNKFVRCLFVALIIALSQKCVRLQLVPLHLAQKLLPTVKNQVQFGETFSGTKFLRGS